MRARLSPVKDNSLQINASKELDERKGIQSIDRAFALLDAFERSQRPLGVTALAEASGMTASQVHHYLVSLVRARAVRQNSSGTYELGTFSLQLGLTALSRIEPVERASEFARQLRDETGEAVMIALWGSHGPTVIRYLEGFQPVTVEVRAGNVMPLETSATGHVFLTWSHDGILPPDVMAKPETKAIRTKTLALGLGRVDGDLLPRISAISAPAFDHDDRLTFALTILGWSGELDISKSGIPAIALKNHAQELSLALGHQPKS